MSKILKPSSLINFIEMIKTPLNLYRNLKFKNGKFFKTKQRETSMARYVFFNSFRETLNSVVTNNHDFSLSMWTLTRLVDLHKLSL